jgi:hypothetical protein
VATYPRAAAPPSTSWRARGEKILKAKNNGKIRAFQNYTRYIIGHSKKYCDFAGVFACFVFRSVADYQ